jgi:hypothetical protein
LSSCTTSTASYSGPMSTVDEELLQKNSKKTN